MGPLPSSAFCPLLSGYSPLIPPTTFLPQRVPRHPHQARVDAWGWEQPLRSAYDGNSQPGHGCPSSKCTHVEPAGYPRVPGSAAGRVPVKTQGGSTGQCPSVSAPPPLVRFRAKGLDAPVSPAIPGQSLRFYGFPFRKFKKARAAGKGRAWRAPPGVWPGCGAGHIPTLPSAVAPAPASAPRCCRAQAGRRRWLHTHVPG